MARDFHYDSFKKNKSDILKNVRHSAEYGLLILFKIFTSFWPVRINQIFGRWFGYLAYLLAGKDRGIANYQLGFCFPDWGTRERRKVLKNTFRNMGSTFFEALIIQKIRKRSHRWIKLEQTEVVQEALKAGKGMILLFAHVDNWELFTVIYEMLDIHGIAIESPIGVKKLDEVLLSLRRSENIKMVPRGDKKTARSILSCFRNNEVMLFAIDQDTRVQSVFVDFFGKKAATAVGTATFAQKFNAPVVSGFGARMKDGTHKVKFELLSQAPYQNGEEEVIQLTQRYNDALEKHIREYPDQWAWFHRRWKNQPDHFTETKNNR